MDFLKEARALFKQERRFYLGRLAERGFLVRLLRPSPTSEEEINEGLWREQKGIQEKALRSKNLGLYRNASLIMASMLIIQERFSETFPCMLDVVFLDMNGANNSLPGYKSYDRRCADLLPLIALLFRGCITRAGVPPDEVEVAFKKQWHRFESFGAPPYLPDMLWKKLKKEIDREKGIIGDRP